MLACTRLGAVHSVVFGGFASHSLASRIDDAKPCGHRQRRRRQRGGKVGALQAPARRGHQRWPKHKPAKVLMVDRGLDPVPPRGRARRGLLGLRAKHRDAQVPCAWLESTEPSYTSTPAAPPASPRGCSATPAAIAVALAASMKHIYAGKPGETYFSTSDIGWVVGHSYIIYGPLIARHGDHHV
jgi:propionyl-CoA synthetase